jgi:hypothetical protein
MSIPTKARRLRAATASSSRKWRAAVSLGCTRSSAGSSRRAWLPDAVYYAEMGYRHQRHHGRPCTGALALISAIGEIIGHKLQPMSGRGDDSARSSKQSHAIRNPRQVAGPRRRPQCGGRTPRPALNDLSVFASFASRSSPAPLPCLIAIFGLENRRAMMDGFCHRDLRGFTFRRSRDRRLTTNLRVVRQSACAPRDNAGRASELRAERGDGTSAARMLMF